MKDFDFDKTIGTPVSKQIAIFLLNSSKYRSDFVNNYSHFNDDFNSDCYMEFIEINILKSDSDFLIDLIDLAKNINYLSNDLIILIENVVKSRRSYFLKLTCLDYLLFNRNNIDVNLYFSLNKKYLFSNNPYLRLQSRLNLIAMGEFKYCNNIKRLLIDSELSTLYYRLINTFWYNIDCFSRVELVEFIIDIRKTLQDGKISQTNINEIENLIKDLLREMKEKVNYGI